MPAVIAVVHVHVGRSRGSDSAVGSVWLGNEGPRSAKSGETSAGAIRRAGSRFTTARGTVVPVVTTTRRAPPVALPLTGSGSLVVVHSVGGRMGTASARGTPRAPLHEQHKRCRLLGWKGEKGTEVQPFASELTRCGLLTRGSAPDWPALLSCAKNRHIVHKLSRSGILSLEFFQH